MPKKTHQDVKQLRAIGHKLKPVVTVSGKGLSESVLAELDRALTDHELIKVRLAVGSRQVRSECARDICEQCGAEIIQSIGNIILILRHAEKPDPRLSNLIKPL